MLIQGKLAEIMVHIYPSFYCKYVAYSAKGVPMLYVSLSKSLYGMLRAALMFYKRLHSCLEDKGFTINNYDPCVANKMVNGAQMTFFWHVHDLKISHRDEEMISIFDIDLDEEFGPKTTIIKGKVHDCLGIDLYFERKPGTLIIYQTKYLQKILEGFPEVLTISKACLYGNHIFNIREDNDRDILCEEMANQFHRTVAQLVFLCKRARPDVETLVSIITIRVK